MKSVVMLVTWMVFGQPPSSYQVAFTSMESCRVARAEVLKDAERVRADSQRKPAGLPANSLYNPGPAPQVTVVCVEQ